MKWPSSTKGWNNLRNHVIASIRAFIAQLRWRSLVLSVRASRGETTVNDPSLFNNFGPAPKRERHDRRKLIAEIRKLADNARFKTTLKKVVIRPVAHVRRPREMPIIFHVNTREAVLRLAHNTVSAMELTGTLDSGEKITGALTPKALYLYHPELDTTDGTHEFWVPVHRTKWPNCPTAVLIAFKKGLQPINPSVS